ncbi:hemin transporter [Cytophaga hutchinsonii]|uniref:Hemoglobin-like protein n=1 Tax=Cytophaga hutchinsonii (strain ATCC 33406 / DSM 1761 / CIP 103989 / NBRC 15051 / NCIMB 9469 / D465) TaxID=269798 RepID=A0A6N4SWG1_CYTH3|nr:hemin transporter [Cytophaga hutchinsonii]ABG60808.1 hemoglobin-like protein [Cytophaga hutchinsonii ATCC 33406]SFX72375.1 hemoglobin [Cytophaga hutchinsonii ATCC 33406]
MEKEALYYRLGKENLDLLVDRFYDLVFVNDQIAHLFKNDKEEIKGKQRLFLTQFLGGPALYSEKFGHPQMRARHMPHPITETDAIAWLHCMSQAIGSLPVSEALKDELFARFPPTAMFMVNKEEQ